MFGDLFGNMEERQEAMRKRLQEIILEAEAGDGAVKISATANREITNVTIDKDKIDPEDVEQIEDLVMVAVNRVLELSKEKEAEEAEKMLKDMLPPGMGGLSNLFG